MASQGPNIVGTGANDAAVGTRSWANPTRIQANDASEATATGVATSTVTSNYIKGTNFGFSIPTDATINGILVEWEKRASDNSTSFTVDNIVKLVIGGTVSGNNKADTTTHWSITSTFVSYGGSSDLWGLSPTPSDINGSTFGAVLACNMTSAGETITNANMDTLRITITYTAAAGGPQSVVSDTVLFT